jgi:hypothetical protein
MNRASPPPTPDDLDRVFSRYFKAQMPSKWPAAPIPVHTAATVPATRGGSWRTRLTLAASVAALLVIGFGVSYGPGSTPNQPKGNGEYLQSGTAGPRPDGKGLGNHIPKDDVQPTTKQP